VLITFFIDLLVKPILVNDMQLVLMLVLPKVVISQELHRVFESAREEVLCKRKTLQLVHGLDLLFSLDSSIVESLVLLLNACNLFLDFLFPIVPLSLLALVALSFEFSNLIDFRFFFHL
jgi:hypothetical protein